MSLTNTLLDQLTAINLPLERFREIALRLLAYGVLVRDEDRTEQLLYDDARRLETLLTEYFEISGLLLHHDRNAQFFRLYAPGAVVDGLAEDIFVAAPSLKARVSADFVAAAITLRFLYQEKLNQGLIDTQAEAIINFEEFAVTLQTQLKRSLPETEGERKSLLAELKRHRLLRYSSTFSIDDEDAYLAIRPTILGIVSNEALSSALEAEETSAATEASEDMAVSI